MARELGLSERTFFRPLGEELTSYQTIEYLRSTRLTVEGIGHRVGFADTANFRKAFANWAGQSPSQCRRDVDAER
jgi:AraC-like DNA-binding protein